MKLPGIEKDFAVIGENIHTTRVVLRAGKLTVTTQSGEEAVKYTTAAGETRYLPIPEDIKGRQDYQEGRVKHIMIAVRAAMSGVEPAATEGMTYLTSLVDKQIAAGADFLDLNVDEVSLKIAEQKDAMRWLVGVIEPLSCVPLSIDSSNQEILLAGLDACRGKAGRPLLNSASLERIDALDVARERGLPVILTAAGASGMPQNTVERVTNASRMVDAALAKGIPPERMYVDVLVFPISVDSQFVIHCLDAFRLLREKYGEQIHLTGGLSNVSFGLPCRKLINEVFINLAVEAGADSGIVDPVANDLNRVFLADRESKPYQLAQEMLLGRDRSCRNYLRAYRKGELAA
ncbi:MAG TPA: dihydropteroate synthase [Bryobacteraceae bacterium]|jgi:5-methyltetrahydrofolate--homocysteine methyltransferase|nr:dihydropteroate synthase [Bryobacteraceae bacterium]